MEFSFHDVVEFGGFLGFSEQSLSLLYFLILHAAEQAFHRLFIKLHEERSTHHTVNDKKEFFV
jgi:hypothetical protein